MRTESWRTWWLELTAAGRARWSGTAAGEFLTTVQLRRLQYEGLLMAGQTVCVEGELRVLVPAELRELAGHRAATAV